MAGSLELIRDAERVWKTDPDLAERICCGVLLDEPDNPLALFLLGSIYVEADRIGLAYQLFKRLIDIAPHRPQAWNNLGMSLESMFRHTEARKCFEEAAKRDRSCADYPANIAMTYLSQMNYRKALEWCDKAFVIDPDHSGAWGTKGFASLATGDWANGWKGYGVALGSKHRKEVQFKDEGRWTGEKDQSVVVYGEQGLGDEIMFASCLPDLIADSRKVMVECDRRLEGLFRRSFPDAHVYGTRGQKEVSWPAAHQIDAGCAIGALPGFYRPTPDSCPGTPYLKADPERLLMWKALMASWGRKPKIGLCWSGGKRHSNLKERTIGLEAFRSLIGSIDADWVSLQYKDPSEEIARTGLPVRHYKRAVQSDDYDDTAALVASLDMVIGVHTAAHHLAGALGVPGVILVPSKSLHYYSLPTMPWYASAKLFKQKEGETWDRTIGRLIGDPVLGRFRPEGSVGIPHVVPIGDRAGVGPGGVQAAVAAAFA